MDIAVKKVQLIEWLTRLQDEDILQRIEALRKNSVKDLYEQQMPKNLEELQTKLERAEEDIEKDNVLAQDSVEQYFKNKFNQ